MAQRYTVVSRRFRDCCGEESTLLVGPASQFGLGLLEHIFGSRRQETKYLKPLDFPSSCPTRQSILRSESLLRCRITYSSSPSRECEGDY